MADALFGDCEVITPLGVCGHAGRLQQWDSPDGPMVMHLCAEHWQTWTDRRDG